MASSSKKISITKMCIIINQFQTVILKILFNTLKVYL